MFKTRLKSIVSGMLLVWTSAYSFAPTTFFPPFDPALRLPPASRRDPFRAGVNVEYGNTCKCRNWNADEHGLLQVHNKSESALPMFDEPTTIDNLDDFLAIKTQLRLAGGSSRVGGTSGSGTFDDGKAGHLKLHGKFEQLDVTPHLRYVLPLSLFPGALAVSAYLPIRHARVHNVHWHDETQNELDWDKDIHELVTDNIKTFVKRFGHLNWSNWSTTGCGDLVCLLDWGKDFPQEKNDLKNVDLHAFIGVSCPTGKDKDEDEAFSVALGNDGAWTMPLGIGIDLDFKQHIALGAEADFEVIFDHTKDRRLKTEKHQTEFLLLNKGRATKDHGLTWKFYLYLQGYRIWRGLSLKAAYEYTKHDSDHLTPKSDNFSSSVANSDRSLDEWNLHEFIFSLNYDFFVKECKDCVVKPQLNIFYKLPVAGKRIIMPQTIGGQFALNF
jgi:opacity protein-like surface antigen